MYSFCSCTQKVIYLITYHSAFSLLLILSLPLAFGPALCKNIINYVWSIMLNCVNTMHKIIRKWFKRWIDGFGNTIGKRLFLVTGIYYEWLELQAFAFSLSLVFSVILTVAHIHHAKTIGEKSINGKESEWMRERKIHEIWARRAVLNEAMPAVCVCLCESEWECV